MTPEEHLKAGDPSAALAALQEKVRADPADAKLRIFLFQLLCILGEWKRAVTQLKVSAELDPLAVPMAQTYREAIICELYREKVFSGEKEPLIFGEPEEWLALLVEAVKHLAEGRAEQAADLRSRAFEAAPAAAGTINGKPFAWIADADMRLGPVLEVIVNGRYFWMPFAAISELKVDEPSDLRDAVWTAATLTLANGGEVVALIPTRYPGTVASGHANALLARATDWQDAGAETFVGIGQRLLATDQEDVAIMDLRTLTMEAPAEAGGAGDDG